MESSGRGRAREARRCGRALPQKTIRRHRPLFNRNASWPEFGLNFQVTRAERCYLRLQPAVPGRCCPTGSHKPSAARVQLVGDANRLVGTGQLNPIGRAIQITG